MGGDGRSWESVFGETNQPLAASLPLPWLVERAPSTCAPLVYSPDGRVGLSAEPSLSPTLQSEPE